MSLSYAQTVEFLRELGVGPADMLDDQPESGLWLTAAGLRLLIAAAPDDAGTFAVRALLTGGPESADATIVITPRERNNRPETTMAKAKAAEFRPGITRAGVVQMLKLRWGVHELLGPGDVLLARVPSSGGWVIETARWLDAGMVMLQGLRFNGAAPPTAGLTWAWEPTRRPKLPERPRVVRDAGALLVQNLAPLPWTPGQRRQDGGDRRLEPGA